ncbi:MAG: zinc ribbon domain-containing protein [Dolichospermum sp.]
MTYASYAKSHLYGNNIGILLSLSQRVFKCEKYGFECDRDVNAAINLKQEAVRLIVLACGLDSADTARVKQEEKANFC